MIEIYDDIIPVEQQIFIEESMTDTAFPWFLTKHGTVQENATEYLNCYIPEELRTGYTVKEYVQFIHMFYTLQRETCSPAHNTITLPIFEKLKIAANLKFTQLLRVKANFQTQCNFSKEEFVNMPHIDSFIDHKVALYYVNDSDGDTVFFKEDGTIIQSVSPKRGRFVVFDGTQYHAGRHPKNSDMRIVINFNFQ
jgi:hypothetical protein